MTTARELLAQFTTQSQMSSFFIDKMGIYNVKSYGAKGDGVTDDTASVEATIVAANIAGGGTIFSPRGTYRFTTAIANSLTLNNIRFTGDNATWYLDFTTASTHLLYLQGSNITVDFLNFDSNPAFARNLTGGAFILVNGANNVFVTENRFNNCPSANIYLVNSAHDIIISNNLIQNSKADGIHITNGSYSVIVNGNNLYNTGDDGISVVWYSNSLNQPQDITISDNLIKNSQASGIAVYHGKNVVIDNNTVLTTINHGIAVAQNDRADNSLDITIQNNYLKNIGSVITSHMGIYIDLVNISIVKNNTIDTTIDQGVYVGRYTNLKIIGNIFRNIATNGIFIINDISLSPHTDLFIQSNTFDTLAGTSIKLTPNAADTLTNVLISDNRIYKNDTDTDETTSIYVSRTSTLRIINNYDYANTDSIQYDSATCTDVILENNYPQARISYTPIVTSTAGAITTYSSSGNYERKGNMVYVYILITITDNGTGSGSINSSLPTNAGNGNRGFFVGREDVISGKMLQGVFTSSSNLRITNYDNTYPGATNAVLKLEGSYEIT